MKKVAILTDSGCDLSPEEAKRLGIYVLRMPIMIGEKEYIEGEEINLDELKEHLRNGEVAKTAQATLGSLIKMYSSLLEEYDEIIHVPLSSGLSGMYQTSVMQAKMISDKITVIDSKAACYPQALICKDIRKMLDDGVDARQIKEIVESADNLYALIIPDDLVYLKRGGRISPAASALASLLKIYPILSVDKGAIDAADKVRTKTKAIKRAIELATDIQNKDDYYWMIIQDEQEELANEMKANLEAIVNDEVYVEKFGAIILSHTGPKTIAVGRIRKLHA